jgi:outer membrane receptor protein involved in Fe transport
LFSAGLSPAVIETVNVMTGGFPAEYGNRFGGVLDVVTKSGLSMRNDGGLAIGVGRAGRRSVAGDFGSPRVNPALQIGRGATVLASYNHFFVPPPIEGVLSSGAGLTARIREFP